MLSQNHKGDNLCLLICIRGRKEKEKVILSRRSRLLELGLEMDLRR